MTKKEESVLPGAVILAGGRGMRMRPLTEDLPKPLLPVGGRTLLRAILENLEEEGVGEALILTGYKGQQIEEEVNAYKGKLRAKCLCDDGQSGSAGSLYKAKGLLGERFFVVSGDIYGRRRYRRFYDFYRARCAKAGMLLCRVREPGEYGAVTLDAEGMVLGFVEKPRWSQVFSDTANAGIYLFEKETLDYIPQGPFDVGGGLLPRLIEAGVPVCGFDDGGVWRDIGDLPTYLACCLAENGGKSVFLGNANAEKSAEVIDSLLFGEVTVGAGSRIEGSIIARGCVVGKNCRLSGCVLGSRCRLGDGVTLAPGTVLPSGSRLTDGESREKTDGQFSPAELKKVISGEALSFGALLPILPAFCRALAREVGGGPVGVYCAPDARAAALRFCAEYRKSGRAVFGGEKFGAQAATLARTYKDPLSVFFSGGPDDQKSDPAEPPDARLLLLRSDGFAPSGAFLRRLRDRTFEESGRQGVFEGSSFAPEERLSSGEKYLGILSGYCGRRLSGLCVGLGAGSPARALARALLSAGAVICAPGKGDCTVKLSRDGAYAELYDKSGKLDRYHIWALLLRAEKEKRGFVAALPYRLPRALFSISASGTKEPEGYPLTPADDSFDALRAEGARLSFLFDGCIAALCVLPFLREKNCRELFESLPPFAVIEQNCDCGEEEKLPFLKNCGGVPAGEGVARDGSGGRTVFRALERRGMHLAVEAARESDCAELLKKALAQLERKRAEEKK